MRMLVKKKEQEEKSKKETNRSSRDSLKGIKKGAASIMDSISNVMGIRSKTKKPTEKKPV